MFDKLIVSEPEGADFKNRRSYFMVSSLVVGVLFLTAVVFSIFAADYGLGSESFELSVVVAPPEITPVDPEPPKPQLPATQSQSQNPLPTRRENMSSVNEPTIVPTMTSAAPNNQMSRPNQPFSISHVESNPDVGPGAGRTDPATGTGPSGLVPTNETSEITTVAPPPLVKKDPPVKRVVSGGVVNGDAKSLPKPVYSAAAKAVGAQGKVDVQVLIDESGSVISAKAITGHPMLREAAEKAARSARFGTTLLSQVPVKVTGVIVYNFTR